MNFGRLQTAMVTPMTKEGEVDFPRAQALARKLILDGTDTLVLSGTTGESPTLSHQEKLELWEKVVDAVGDQATVVAGTGTNDTRTTIELTREAERKGVHGIMLVTPYYNKPSQEGLYQHMRRASETVSLPVMLYNVPSRTSVNMVADTVLRLAGDVPNIVAVKEASGDLDQVADIARGRPKGFRIYSGDDKMTLPIMAIGGDGVVSVASHLVGRQILEMLDAFDAGHVKKALAVHLRLLPLFRGLFAAPNPVPLKTAMRLSGFDVGPVRLPLCGMDTAQEERLIALLRETQLV